MSARYTRNVIAASNTRRACVCVCVCVFITFSTFFPPTMARRVYFISHFLSTTRPRPFRMMLCILYTLIYTVHGDGTTTFNPYFIFLRLFLTSNNFFFFFNTRVRYTVAGASYQPRINGANDRKPDGGTSAQISADSEKSLAPPYPPYLFRALTPRSEEYYRARCGQNCSSYSERTEYRDRKKFFFYFVSKN